MARAVTLGSIVERARFHADMEASGFASDAKCLALLNEIYPKLYDELVMASENYYAAVEDIPVNSQSASYVMPDDFYKILSVGFSSDNGRTFFPLSPFPEAERNTGYTTTNLPTGTIRIRYVPSPATFTSLSETVDGVAGWDRMLTLLLAIDLLDQEESNSDRLFRKYQEEVRRINATSDRDLGMPARVADIYETRFNYEWVRYRLYGNLIEFISTEYVGI